MVFTDGEREILMFFGVVRGWFGVVRTDGEPPGRSALVRPHRLRRKETTTAVQGGSQRRSAMLISSLTCNAICTSNPGWLVGP